MINSPNKTIYNIIKAGVQPFSCCYTQARAFHQVYRNLLRVLHKTFNGEPEKISEVVELMESLQVHAKRCTATPLAEDTDSNYKCGPVWDYDW